jgi:hypothetical protein
MKTEILLGASIWLSWMVIWTNIMFWKQSQTPKSGHFITTILEVLAVICWVLFYHYQ